MDAIDQVELAFNATSLNILNVVLGLVLFGVALDLKLSHLTDLIKAPMAPLVGLFAQFLVLPAFAFALCLALDIPASMKLGLLLVAACPGGNLSNFFTHFSKGNTAVSVGMTMVSTAAAIVTTPLNFVFWASMAPDTNALLKEVSLDPLQMLVTVTVLLGIPLVGGMSVARYLPGVAARLRRPFKWGSLAFFVIFLFVAFGANFDHFIRHISSVFLPVLLLNAGALIIGYTLALAASLPDADRRAVAIEVGIQNSGLGLVLIFNFFGGLGGMAIAAAWWGIWHLVTGLTLSTLWSRFPPAIPAPAQETAV